MDATADSPQASLPSPPSPPSCVTVAVRVRPLNELEKASPSNGVAWSWSSGTTIQSRRGARHADGDDDVGDEWSPSTVLGPMRFDHVFAPEDATNASGYTCLCKDLVASFVHGFNASIFAYGQTSSGKTHTLTGTTSEPGVTILLLKDVFENVSLAAGVCPSSTLASVKLSFVEIYNDALTDLLFVDTDDAEGAAPGRKTSSRSSMSGGDGSKGSNNHFSAPPKLTIVNERRGQVRVQGLTTLECSSIDDALELLARGERQRRVAATKMNKTSSRSHSVLRIELERTVIGGERQTSILNVVDLAGSERVGGTGMSPAPRSPKSLASSNSRTSDAGGKRWKEGINIVS